MTEVDKEQGSHGRHSQLEAKGLEHTIYGVLPKCRFVPLLTVHADPSTQLIHL